MVRGSAPRAMVIRLDGVELLRFWLDSFRLVLCLWISLVLVQIRLASCLKAGRNSKITSTYVRINPNSDEALTL